MRCVVMPLHQWQVFGIQGDAVELYQPWTSVAVIENDDERWTPSTSPTASTNCSTRATSSPDSRTAWPDCATRSRRGRRSERGRRGCRHRPRTKPSASRRPCRLRPRCRYVDVVVVVDDGSSDDTGDIARSAGTGVANIGATAARPRRWKSGAEAVRILDQLGHAPRHLLFLDADLGDTAATAGPLVQPVVDDEADMTIAILPRQYSPGGGRGRVVRLSSGGMEMETKARGKTCVYLRFHLRTQQTNTASRNSSSSFRQSPSGRRHHLEVAANYRRAHARSFTPTCRLISSYTIRAS